jgi:diadenylate cyclase
MPVFKISFISVTLNDIVDIIIVAVIIYALIRWLKGTRSVQMFFAIVLLFIISILADTLRLHGLSWIMSSIKTIGLLAFFIVFQPEIRSALTRLGGIGFADIFFKKQKSAIPVDLLVESAVEISKRSLGGLIIIEKKVGLRNVLETGKALHALVTPELITAVFSKHSPLHDGAIVIQGDRIAAAACVLPMLQNPRLEERQFGMRHRAALGMASESDAIVIVISEETGQISVAHEKEFVRGISAKELKEKIEFYLEKP